MTILIISNYQVDIAGLAESETQLAFGNIMFERDKLLINVESEVMDYRRAESEEYPDDCVFRIKTTADVHTNIASNISYNELTRIINKAMCGTPFEIEFISEM